MVLTGDLRGSQFEIREGTSRLGRGSDMDIRISTDEYVSRHHADVVVRKNTLQLVDGGSTNGSYVNAERVRKVNLKDGDRILVGTTTLKLLYADDIEKAYLDEMYRLATRDGLTDVFNKRYLLEQLEIRLSEARRLRRHLGVYLMDLDFFKRVNDDYGHVAGDRVLQDLASLLSSLMRREDILARFGGEEFSILSPGMEPERGTAVAERIRKSVEEHLFVFDRKRVPVTVSVGAWITIPLADTTSEELLKKSDEALYRAKHEGRNRCVVLT